MLLLVQNDSKVPLRDGVLYRYKDDDDDPCFIVLGYCIILEEMLRLCYIWLFKQSLVMHTTQQAMLPMFNSLRIYKKSSFVIVNWISGQRFIVGCTGQRTL